MVSIFSISFLTSYFSLDPKWRFKVYMYAIPRVVDFTNIDFIKHKFKFPEVME